MTLVDLVAALRAINERKDVDEERDHINADDLIVTYLNSQGELGNQAAKAYEAIGKWYS